MTLPIERFKDSYQNWRWNPFTDTDMAVDAEEDGLLIPAGAPFIIQLLEQPRYNDPSSASVRCYGVKTDVDEESLLGQKVLKVAATAGFSPSDTIIIDRGGDREEEKIIDTIQGGISLTVTVNLEYTHTAVQADDVEKFIAFTETAGAPAQSQYRVDYPPDDGGEGTGLIEFNQNDADKEVRVNYKATGSPALAETLDTKISYPAGAPNDNQIVGFSSGVPYWLQLPHSNLAGVSADQHHPQAHSHAHSAITGVSANQHHNQVHTMASHSNFANYLNQPVRTGDEPTFEIVNAMNKVRLWDTGRDHYVSLKLDENLSANQQLNIVMNNAYRTMTFTGNPTLADWFNQNVKSSASPSFVNLTLTGVASTLQGGTKLALEAGATGICSATIEGDETGNAANMYISSSSPYRILKSTSALKYKNKVKNLELDSSLIHQLRPVSFNSLCAGDDKEKRFIGLIADEIEQVYPEIVRYSEDNKADGYDNQMLLTLVIAELQKLKKQMTN